MKYLAGETVPVPDGLECNYAELRYTVVDDGIELTNGSRLPDYLSHG